MARAFLLRLGDFAMIDRFRTQPKDLERHSSVQQSKAAVRNAALCAVVAGVAWYGSSALMWLTGSGNGNAVAVKPDVIFINTHPVKPEGRQAEDSSVGERDYVKRLRRKINHYAADKESTLRSTDSYIYISTRIPERLYLVKNGHVVLESLVNTGILQSPTPHGEFHIFAKYRRKWMEGVNPVTHRRYLDPNVPYAMYFTTKGNAIHGFERKAYGYPQSFGCVEMPPDEAKTLYRLVRDGTKVVIK